MDDLNRFLFIGIFCLCEECGNFNCGKGVCWGEWVVKWVLYYSIIVSKIIFVGIEYCMFWFFVIVSSLGILLKWEF